MTEQAAFNYFHTDTLSAAKKELWEGMEKEGIDCPCCGRFAKMYRYTISKAQIAAFHWIAMHSLANEYIEVQRDAPRWLLQSNSHGKLVHWGLLEQKPNVSDETHKSGCWRLTKLGWKFHRGLASVQQYALVFNNKCFGHEGEEQYFRDRFESFHYADLMSREVAEVTNANSNNNTR